jgi:hypothetical protein
MRNLASDVKRMLEVPVKLTDHGKAKRVSTQEAMLPRLREKALKGDGIGQKKRCGAAIVADDGSRSVRRRDDILVQRLCRRGGAVLRIGESTLAGSLRKWDQLSIDHSISHR